VLFRSFFNKRIPFEGINVPAISLWHFSKGFNRVDYDPNIAKRLNYGAIINKCAKNRAWVGCFGVQSFIKHSFLIHIMNKYHIPNLLHVVTNRSNRCCLERIFAIIFFLELRVLNTSILGKIDGLMVSGSTYESYIQDLKNRRLKAPVIKVFTGR